MLQLHTRQGSPVFSLQRATVEQTNRFGVSL